MLARLMRTVEDTTALHRCGHQGLRQIRHDGARLEALIYQGDDPIPFLSQLNRDYVRMNLTMGGVADVLALSYGCLVARGVIPNAAETPDAKIPPPRRHQGRHPQLQPSF
jgi:triphosphoribosyl-dephospho-CoA synthase